MSIESMVIIGFTAAIHLVGIGAFIAWMAAGYPMSLDQLKAKWKQTRILPSWANKASVDRP